MKVSKWVDFGQDVQIDIGVEDVRSALNEAFHVVSADRLGEPGPNRPEVSYALNDIAIFLKAMRDEHIAKLTPGVREKVAAFLMEQSVRFRVRDQEGVNQD